MGARILPKSFQIGGYGGARDPGLPAPLFGHSWRMTGSLLENGGVLQVVELMMREKLARQCLLGLVSGQRGPERNL